MRSFLAAAAVLAAPLLAALSGAPPAHAETVRVGIAAEPYPPFAAPDASGSWTGWEIDISKAVCAAAKLDCVITPVSWDGIIPALTSNKIDMIMASMSITDERRKSIDFSDRYYNTPTGIVATKGSGLKPTDASLGGKILGVQVSTVHETYARKHFPDAEIKTYQTQDEANQDLVAGRVDAVQADKLALDTFLASDAGKGCCEAAGTVEPDEAVLGPGVGVGLRKGDEALKEKVNGAIKAIRADGRYDEISKRYFAFDIYGG